MKKECLIFANGQMDETSGQTAKLIAGKADIIIAADGGINHCLQLGLTPDFLVGDLDSSPGKLVRAMDKAGITILSFPPEKEQTDLELSLDLALEQSCRKIFLFGGLGNRWDMSLANLFLVVRDKYAKMEIIIIDRHTTIQAIKSGQKITLKKEDGISVSLIPLQGDANGISMEGFKYKLQGETLTFGSTRGISNILRNDKGAITVASGIVLCIQSTLS